MQLPRVFPAAAAHSIHPSGDGRSCMEPFWSGAKPYALQRARPRPLLEFIGLSAVGSLLCGRLIWDLADIHIGSGFGRAGDASFP